jgi:LysM repeat protein
MKKKIIFFMFMVTSVVVTAQKSTPQQYIQKYASVAIREMNRSGVPVSITLAQGILESESGNSDLASKSNNHFGIKCKSNWEGAKVYHNDDEKGECFRKYDNVEQSYIDHSDFLKANTRYAFLFDLDKDDYHGWAKGLKKAGYATNPVYAQKLIEIIEKYELHLIKAPTGIVAENTTANELPKDAPTDVVETDEVSKVVYVELIEKPTNEDLEKQFTQKPFLVNQVKAIKVLKGTSILAIADMYGISFSKLIEYNDWSKDQADILETESVVFLQKKRKQGSTPIHIVKPNETLHQIAQLEGVKLESLLRINSMLIQEKLVVGQELLLQGKSTTNKLTKSK